MICRCTDTLGREFLDFFHPASCRCRLHALVKCKIPGSGQCRENDAVPLHSELPPMTSCDFYHVTLQSRRAQTTCTPPGSLSLSGLNSCLTTQVPL